MPRREEKERTYRAVLPENDYSLEDEEVRDPDGDDREHRARKDELLASAARSATSGIRDEQRALAPARKRSR